MHRLKLKRKLFHWRWFISSKWHATKLCTNDWICQCRVISREMEKCSKWLVWCMNGRMVFPPLSDLVWCEWLAFLNVLWIGTYPRDIDASNRFDQFGNFVDNLQHFSGELGRAYFAAATRHHGDFLGLWQWGCYLSSDLKYKTISVNKCRSVRDGCSFTFGNVSNNMSTIAASRYSLQASAFLAICSASAFAFAEMITDIKIC